MKNANRLFINLLIALVVGQVVSFVAAPDSWKNFIAVLPKILSMIAFWGPIIGLVVFGLVAATMRLLGFASLDEIRRESVDENNPAPAVIFAGTLIASILFLMIVIKP
ncbi:MAG: hypothetical protein LC099_05020 [Anaerolineales bacterium]|nr:hypothetical protein [Anaerolineales bacterium]